MRVLSKNLQNLMIFARFYEVGKFQWFSHDYLKLVKFHDFCLIAGFLCTFITLIFLFLEWFHKVGKISWLFCIFIKLAKFHDFCAMHVHDICLTSWFSHVSMRLAKFPDICNLHETTSFQIFANFNIFCVLSWFSIFLWYLREVCSHDICVYFHYLANFLDFGVFAMKLTKFHDFCENSWNWQKFIIIVVFHWVGKISWFSCKSSCFLCIFM